ncbi:hypothetical protein [Nocardia carnea]|uniref:hypothetical protein n=1 Tax=Nocardia carnea TaxID=37328 RepID=UPI002457F79E|nr:hypothetical protein [Nocardia carnea]
MAGQVLQQAADVEIGAGGRGGPLLGADSVHEIGDPLMRRGEICSEIGNLCHDTSLGLDR